MKPTFETVGVTEPFEVRLTIYCTQRSLTAKVKIAGSALLGQVTIPVLPSLLQFVVAFVKVDVAEAANSADVEATCINIEIELPTGVVVGSVQLIEPIVFPKFVVS